MYTVSTIVLDQITPRRHNVSCQLLYVTFYNIRFRKQYPCYMGLQDGLKLKIPQKYIFICTS